MSVMLANGGSDDRKFSDYYPTPPECTHALLDFLALPKGTEIWEPACGSGHMANVFRERGYVVEESDITLGMDYLLSGDSLCDWVITNPPFSLAADFIEHAFMQAPGGGFAFLLKSQYWHASKRLQLFNDYRPDHVLPLTWRPDFLFGAKSGAPTMEVLWTVWKWPYTATRTIYQPLRKPTCHK
jgi:hypothetical protein